MSLFRRGQDSPPTNGYFSGASTPRALSPIWRSSKRGGLDAKRILQLVGTIIGIVVLYAFLHTIFGSSRPEEDNYLADGLVNKNHFVDFEGGLDCRLSSTELYVPPIHDTPQAKKRFPYCKNRAALLEALSNGGRHGFDAPYTPKGCHYKWYSPNEICMILDRFDGVVFIGDDIIHRIYAAFNILLRRDLALGSLQQWKMTDKERDSCRCSNQFTKPDCSKHFVTSSEDVGAHDAEGGYRAPFACNRIPHFYLPIKDSPAPGDETEKFTALLEKDLHSWKPVAIIHSIGLSTVFQWGKATDSMDEWLTIADNSGRNTPFLWVGPNAAGHLKPPNKIMQEGNNALWHYTMEMGKEAGRRGVEHLANYNNTLQAQSFDGSSYGERVSLVQAMEIVNWLARLETT